VQATELKRLARFVVTGVIATGVTYVVLIGLMKLGAYYMLAGVASWASGLAVGFVLNRRFTFGITGRERRTRDFGLYLTGALLQLALGLGCYAVTIGWLRLNPTLAFVINLPITTAFSFLFLRFVAFRRASAPTPQRTVD
jgi:putative flippase GtrA